MDHRYGSILYNILVFMQNPVFTIYICTYIIYPVVTLKSRYINRKVRWLYNNNMDFIENIISPLGVIYFVVLLFWVQVGALIWPAQFNSRICCCFNLIKILLVRNKITVPKYLPKIRDVVTNWVHGKKKSRVINEADSIIYFLTKGQV